MADFEPEVEYYSGTEWDIVEIPKATPTFLTMPEPLVTLSALADVAWQPRFKMADYKPEVECLYGTEWDIAEIPTATTTFSTIPELMVTPPTMSDIARCQPTTIIQNGGLKTGSRMLVRNRMRYRRNSKGYPHIFDHARTVGDTVSSSRRRSTTEIQNGGL